MKKSAVIMMIILFCSGSMLTVHAEEHYDVYIYDRWDEAVSSQAGYTAERSVSGIDLGTEAFSEPADIFRDKQGQFLIADTKNNRIVITDSELTKTIRILKECTDKNGKRTMLKSPEGIYVSPETEQIYIADYGNERVLVCDPDGNLLIEIIKPETALFSQELPFLPKKVIADKAGNIYIILENITEGAAMFSPDGVFLGFYGANTIEETPARKLEYFWKSLITEQMRSRTARTIPAGITNFDLDQEGFIYTCTQSISQKKDTVKKLNPAGTNLFSSLGTVWGDMESVYDANTNKTYQSMLCDIEISEDGNINCLDLAQGRIFQYDKEGNLLFIFGASGDQLGCFTEVRALESSENQIFVLDSAKNSITIFHETDFGKAVHKAEALYNNGYYEESLMPWYEVLQYDGRYRRAFLGISAGLLVKGEYKDSMKYAKLADSPERYDKAFKCYRSEWLSAHSRILTIMFLLIIGDSILKWHRKRRKQHDGFQ